MREERLLLCVTMTAAAAGWATLVPSDIAACMLALLVQCNGTACAVQRSYPV
jgi:hypothetical protein